MVFMLEILPFVQKFLGASGIQIFFLVTLRFLMGNTVTFELPLIRPIILAGSLELEP